MKTLSKLIVKGFTSIVTMMFVFFIGGVAGIIFSTIWHGGFI